MIGCSWATRARAEVSDEIFIDLGCLLGRQGVGSLVIYELSGKHPHRGGVTIS
jgi:hypothetical protein